MQTKILRRKCDYCGNVEDFPENGLNPTQGQNLESWIMLAREFMVNDEARPWVLHACKDSCASNLISTGALNKPQGAKPCPS